MPRFYLRLALLPTILLTVVLIGIRSQPYDDHELHELLLPTGCAAPCFMGIQAGITTVEEAVKLLEASEWVSKVANEMAGNNSGFIYWNWSNQAPTWISKNDKGKLYATDKIVYSILIDTRFVLGDTRLVFGLPNLEIVEPSQSPNILYTAYYDQLGFTIHFWYLCHSSHPLLHKIRIGFSVSLPIDNFLHRDSLNDLFRAC